MPTTKAKEMPELHFITLKGKQYLPVQQRVLWFRFEHPDWTLDTEIVERTDRSAVVRAFVKDDTGRLIATGLKTETAAGFADFLEKAETGAIGRALALCGYGTQFAAELDEGSDVVDAPVGENTNPDEATPAQKKFVADLAIEKLGAKEDDADDIIAKLNQKFGMHITSSADLTKFKARAIIESLKATQPPAADNQPNHELADEEDTGMSADEIEQTMNK